MNYYIKNQDYYIKNQDYYYDFRYLKALSGFATLKLHYLLDKEEINRVRYQDFWLYKLEDLQKSKIFSDIIQPKVIQIDDLGNGFVV